LHDIQKEMDTIKHWRGDGGVFDDALLLEDRADSGPAAATGVRASARGALRSPGARLRQSHLLRESTGLGTATGAAAAAAVSAASPAALPAALKAVADYEARVRAMVGAADGVARLLQGAVDELGPGQGAQACGRAWGVVQATLTALQVRTRCSVQRCDAMRCPRIPRTLTYSCIVAPLTLSLSSLPPLVARPQRLRAAAAALAQPSPDVLPSGGAPAALQVAPSRCFAPACPCSPSPRLCPRHWRPPPPCRAGSSRCVPRWPTR